MALITTFQCISCKGERFEAVHPSRVCYDCRQFIAKEELSAFLAKRNMSSPEERLTLLEKEMFELQKQLKQLAANNIRY